MTPKIPDPMGGMEELYREIILDHFKSPHNKGHLPGTPIQGEGTNPLCGDTITVSIEVDGDKLKDIRFDGRGCAISQASASMMTDAVKGQPLREVDRLTQSFKEIYGIRDGKDAQAIKINPEDLGELASLEGVKKYPVRIKCAVLPWNTLLETLKKVRP